MLEAWQLAVLSLVGVVAGWLNVMAGGGSMITLPVLLAMGLPGPVANGSNRIGVVLQSLSATITFLRRGYGNFRLSLSLSFFACIGAIGGAQVGVGLDGELFDRLLAIVMVAVLLSMIFEPRSGSQHKGPKPPPSKRRLWIGHACMIGVGFWGGMIQVGVGFLMMPVLYRIMGLDLVMVNVHRVLITLIFTTVALVIFAAQVPIDWVAGLALALGTILGGALGAHTNIRKGYRWIRGVLMVTLVAFIVKLLL